MASTLGGLPTLAAMDRRLRFFVGYGVVVLACLVVHMLVFSWLVDMARSTSTKVAEAARMERIGKQTWWTEENAAALAEIEAIKGRFWKGDTIGLVRAELERFIQQLLVQHELKAQTLVVDTKVTETKGIPLLRAQVKIIGQTAGVLDLLDGLASGPSELFVAGVVMQLRNDQSMIDITLDAPTLVSEK